MSFLMRATYLLAFLGAPAMASEAGTNPLEKVVELLGVLSKEISVDAEEDAKVYKADTDFYNKEHEQSDKIIKTTGDKIAQLEEDIKEAEALREGKSKELVETANHLAEDDAKLTEGRGMRKKERAHFEENEAAYLEASDQLTRALEVMDKKMPTASSGASTSASLISVAEQLKKTLTRRDSEVRLSTVQKETLNDFVRTAYFWTESRSSQSPSFLQQAAHLHRRKGDFESHADGLVTILQDLHGKITKEQDANREHEVENKKNFVEWETGIVEHIENGKKHKADLTSTIAQLQQQSSQNEASLLEDRQLYNAQVHHIEAVEKDYRVRTQDYKIRLAKRSDEEMAVHEAQRILSSVAAKDLIKYQTIGTVDQGATSLLQVSRKRTMVRRTALQVRKTALRIFKRAATPGLALLALKSTVQTKIGAEADPFGKVRSMIKGMLEKLMAAQAQETEHAAWCDKEMGKTTKSQRRKEDDIQKIKDRLDALQAELTQTNSDLNTTGTDLKDMQASLAEAVAVRSKEHKSATDAIKMYKDGVALLKRARDVLTNYYRGSANKGPEVHDNKIKQRQGLGSGVVGILEVAIEDFQSSYEESKVAEATAAKDFNQFKSENHIRIAVFKKDLEYNNRAKVKLEFDESQMKNDLKSYEQELSAVDTYMDKLKASCVIRAPSYEEKKTKREATLKSLKEALDILMSEGTSR